MTFDEIIRRETNDNSFLKRAFMFLTDGDFERADQYAEKVLDIDPENVIAYLCKMMIDYKVQKKEDLINHAVDFGKNINYKKIMSFGDEKIKEELNSYIETACEKLYNIAKASINQDTVEHYNHAIFALGKILGYKDSKMLMEKCKRRSEEIKAEKIYSEAVALMHNDGISSFNKAQNKFEQIPMYKDSKALIEVCKKEILYKSAHAELQSKRYSSALQKFKLIKGWRDSEALIVETEKKEKKKTKTIITSVLAPIIVFSSIISIIIIGIIIASVVGTIRSNREIEKNFEYRVGLGDYTIIEKYKGAEAEVVIPSSIGGYPVEYIGEGAFKNCTHVKSVTIPDSVTCIEEEAFANCTSLEKVIIPESVTHIYKHAFTGNPDLRIYCERLSRPRTWQYNWYSEGTVTWGYKGKK